MPTIKEAIEKLNQTSIEAITVKLAALSNITQEAEVNRAASQLRADLKTLLDSANHALSAVIENHSKNDVSLFMLEDDNMADVIFLSSGIGFGKKWLIEYVKSYGYKSPFDRQPFSEEDKRTIFAATGIALSYPELPQYDERIDLTEQALAVIEDSDSYVILGEPSDEESEPSTIYNAAPLFEAPSFNSQRIIDRLRVFNGQLALLRPEDPALYDYPALFLCTYSDVQLVELVALSVNVRQEILLMPSVILRWIELGASFSVICELNSRLRLYMYNHNDSTKRFLNEGISFLEFAELTPTTLDLIFTFSSEIILLKRNENISFEMLSRMSKYAFLTIFNGQGTIAQKAELIRACQPVAIINDIITLESNEILQSTIRELWKNTRSDNVGLFVSKTLAETTYRNIQKTYRDQTLSYKDRAFSVISLINNFVITESDEHNTFRIALINKFKNIESLTRDFIQLTRTNYTDSREQVTLTIQ